MTLPLDDLAGPADAVLLGPSDADHFRVKVGRYGERWYTDPQPGCSVAEASDWVGPAVTITKPPFANKYVPMRAIADMPSDDWARLSAKDADERYEAIKIAEKIGARLNMDRGSIVHRYAEDKLLGRETIEQFLPGTPKALEQAKRFLPALNAFFDTYQPELVVAEAVCLHRTLNGVGYGGTTDAIVKIEGDLWDVDWKSRNSDHAAYGEEAGQGGAYIGAQYMIVTGPDGNPMRSAIPDVAGVLIVSIREDGFRAYPIDADGAIAHYEAMHRWWCAQQELTANKVIGRPWATKAAKNSSGSQPAVEAVSLDQVADSATDEATTSSVAGYVGRAQPSSHATPPSVDAAATEDWRLTAKRRYRSWSTDEQLAYTERKHDIDTTDPAAVFALMDEIDRFNVVVIKPEPDVQFVDCRIIEPPDEGGTVDQADVDALKNRYIALPYAASLWTGMLVAQGNRTHPFRIRDRASVRRYELYRGILAIAEWVKWGEE